MKVIGKNCHYHDDFTCDCWEYGLKYNEKAPSDCPQSRIWKEDDGYWPGKQEFMNKVRKVEEFFKDGKNPNYEMMGQDGLALSRIEKTSKDGSEVWVGSDEYHDHNAKMCWPQNYINHYIEKHNVLPSKKFYEYIMNLKLPDEF